MKRGDLVKISKDYISLDGFYNLYDLPASSMRWKYVIGKIDQDQVCLVLEIAKSSFKVLSDQGITGWIGSDLLEIVHESR